jgi:hypothetical protein
MFVGLGGESRTSKFQRGGFVWGVLFIAVVSLVWLLSMPVGIHRSVDDEDRLVAELTAPESPDQLLSSLSKVNTWSRMPHAGGRKPDQLQILKLSYALRSVLKVYPELPEAWQAAGSLITSRARPTAPVPSEICGKEYKRDTNSPDLTSVGHEVLPKYTNCTIVLDEAPQIVNSNPLFDKRQSARYANGTRRPLLCLQNAHVVYKGGEILPVDGIACVDCTFEFDVRFPPPQRGRTLMRALLVANDIANVGVELSDSRE